LLQCTMAFSDLPVELRLIIFRTATRAAFKCFMSRAHAVLTESFLRWEKTDEKRSPDYHMVYIRHEKGPCTMIFQWYTTWDVPTRRVVEVISSRSISSAAMVFTTYLRAKGTTEWVKMRDAGRTWL